MQCAIGDTQRDPPTQCVCLLALLVLFLKRKTNVSSFNCDCSVSASAYKIEVQKTCSCRPQAITDSAIHNDSRAPAGGKLK